MIKKISTRLFDKNGREIFEGDRVTTTQKMPERCLTVVFDAVVTYVHGTFQCIGHKKMATLSIFYNNSDNIIEVI